MKKTARTRLIEERKRRQWSQQEIADCIGTTRHNVSRWEAGLTTPGPYFRAKLCELFGTSAQKLGLLDTNPSPSAEREAEVAVSTGAPPANTPALWTVPYLRNLHFTGREELLKQLDQQFSASRNEASTQLRGAALTQPRAIKGLGGIGKTQIAVEYAYRAREQSRYTHILWINAASEEAIMTSFVALAEMLPAFAAAKETDQHKLVEAIIRWLEQCQERWLLIFDNADNVALLQPYLPHHGNGNLLFTTRAHAVGSFAVSIDVEKMGLVEGTMLLLHRAQRQQASDEERNEAINIVITLDGFPLALDQAGAYIEETECSFSDYLQTYQKHHQALLARRGAQATNYPDSVATTWSLSFQHIAQTNPAASELLHLCAFLAPDAIPEELLTEGAAHWPIMLQQAVTDHFAFNHLLEALLRFSLVKRRVKEHTLSLHRLVQVVQRDTMELEEQRQWAKRVVLAVHRVFPGNPKEDVATWPLCLRSLEQAQACDVLIQQYQLLLPEAAELLDRAAMYLREHASYALAEPLYQRALSIWEQTYGSEHIDIARSLGNLANLYSRQGKYALAEEAYKRALHILEQTVSLDHHQITAAVLNHLASLYYEQGKYRDAELLYERALRLREQEVGPDHLRVASPLNNLALLYQELGKYAEAETLNLRALHIWEQARGPEHPDVAFALNGLAELYVKRGKYEEAESLFTRAISIREQTLGLQHPNVAHPLHGLAELYVKLGKYEEAEPLLQRALQIWEQSVGPEHDATAGAFYGLGHLFAQRNQEQAEEFFQRALRIREQQLGPEHPEVAHSLSSLAGLYCEQEKYAEAEPLYQRALAIWKRQLGETHPQTAHTLNGLAHLYTMQGKYTEAESLFQQALHIQEQILGELHLETAETLHDFAALQKVQGKRQQAISFYQRALTIREQILGETHPTTMATRTSYLAVLHTRESTEEAVAIERASSEEISL